MKNEEKRLVQSVDEASSPLTESKINIDSVIKKLAPNLQELRRKRHELELSLTKIKSDENSASLAKELDESFQANDEIEFKIIKLILQNKNQLESWLDDPNKDGLLEYHQTSSGNMTRLWNLTECACTEKTFLRIPEKAFKYNESLTNRRKIGEDHSVQELIKHCPPKLDLTLNYLSLGNGGLLQDFFNIAKLISKGYKRLCIALVEPDKTVVTSQTGFKELLTILKNTYELEDLQIYFYQNSKIEDIISDSKCPQTFHFVSIVDFDDINKKSSFHSVVEAHKLLDKNGILFLSVNHYDLLFGKQGLIESSFYQNEHAPLFWKAVYQKIKQYVAINLVTHLSSKKTLNYTCMTPHFLFQFLEAIEIFPLFQATGIKNVEYTLQNLFKDEIVNDESINLNNDYQYFVQLLAPYFKVSLHLKSVNDIFKTKPTESKSDMVTYVGASSLDLRESYTIHDFVNRMRILGGHQFIGARVAEYKGQNPGLINYSIYLQTQDSEQTTLPDDEKENKESPPHLNKNKSVIIYEPEFDLTVLRKWIETMVISKVPKLEKISEEISFDSELLPDQEQGQQLFKM